MQPIISSREAYDKYNALLNDVVLQLKEYTAGAVIDFGEQGFEDMSGNDICAIDDESVYMGADFDMFETQETYPLHELDLMDAVRILGDLETGVLTKNS